MSTKPFLFFQIYIDIPEKFFQHVITNVSIYNSALQI